MQRERGIKKKKVADERLNGGVGGGERRVWW